MTLQNQSLDAAERALARIVKGQINRQRSPLSKSLDRLRDRFGLDADETANDRITAARARSRSTPQESLPVQDDSFDRSGGQIPVDGPEWIPLHQRLAVQQHALMLRGVAEAQKDIDARRQEQALSDDVGAPGRDSQARMRAAQQCQPRSRQMPGSGR